MDVDLDALRCFLAAAMHSSFRAAAREVGRSPAAFGQRVKLLEDRLGVPLFVRTTRTVSLTVEGVRALAPARAALAAAVHFADVARGGARAPYALTIGTRFELGLSWLVPSLRALCARDAARTLHVVFGDGPDLVARTLTGELDATLTSARLANARLRSVALHEERYVFVAGRPLWKRAQLLKAAEAAQHTLIDAAPDLPLFRYFLDACPNNESWDFGNTELLSTVAAMRLRVLEGAGVAVLPRFVVEKDLASGAAMALFRRRALPRDRVRIVWRDGHPREQDLTVLAGDLTRLPSP